MGLNFVLLGVNAMTSINTGTIELRGPDKGRVVADIIG